MQEVSFEDALEILTIKDPRYPREAYLFVREALDHTQRTLARDKEGCIRHVTGQELLVGIKEYAATQFGPMAMMVLQEWGIHSCQDFGELVFNMVETGGCPLLAVDDIIDLPAFAERLNQHADSFTSFLWEGLSEKTRQSLANNPTGTEFQETLVGELNALITKGVFYQEDRFSGIVLTPVAKALIGHELKGIPLAQFNRLLLECAFPSEITKCHGLLAKTKNDTRADFEEGYDFFEAFRKPYLPPSKQSAPQCDPAPSHT